MCATSPYETDERQLWIELRRLTHWSPAKVVKQMSRMGDLVRIPSVGTLHAWTAALGIRANNSLINRNNPAYSSICVHVIPLKGAGQRDVRDMVLIFEPYSGLLLFGLMSPTADQICELKRIVLGWLSALPEEMERRIDKIIVCRPQDEKADCHWFEGAKIDRIERHNKRYAVEYDVETCGYSKIDIVKALHAHTGDGIAKLRSFINEYNRHSSVLSPWNISKMRFKPGQNNKSARDLASELSPFQIISTSFSLKFEQLSSLKM